MKQTTGARFVDRLSIRPDGTPPPLLRVAAIVVRLLGAAYFFTTALYCAASYSSFAYYQFLRPGLLSWPAQFVVMHHWLFALWVVLVAMTLEPYLHVRRTRWWAAAYLCAMSALSVWLLSHPVLAAVENSPASLRLGLLALVPPLMLAVLDHWFARVSIESQPIDRRSLAVFLVTALAVVLTYGGAAAYRSTLSPGLGLSWKGVALGLAVSSAVHGLVFVAAFFLVWATARVARRVPASGDAQFVMLAIAGVCATTALLTQVIFAAIAFTGREALVMALALAVTTVTLWSSIARWRMSGWWQPVGAVDAFAAPVIIGKRWTGVLITLSLPLLGVLLPRAVERDDWDFLLQKLSVLGAWLVAFGIAHRLVSRMRPATSSAWPIAACLAASSVAVAAVPATFPSPLKTRSDVALDRYLSIDPSLHLLTSVSRGTSGDAAGFYSFLRANSTIAHTPVSPIEIDFARPTVPERRPPHIFLFVVDSLRRDYVSPYNPQVTFTPGIAAFAKDSVVFRRAFTRYGGTGLAVPSIWAGGMLLHKQYIAPSTPMSTLDKLLDAAQYRRIMSVDPITERLMAAPAKAHALDAKVMVKDYRLCGTLSELRQTLATTPVDRPIFAYTLPQDVHMSNSFKAPVPAGESYPGFFEPVAARVHQLDACFGEFIADLKARGLYDDSIVILTSDHGDSLGEEGRWGHAYTVFPEVMQIPLIVHVPARLASSFTAWPWALSFSTDISPTLHALLGYPPSDLGTLYGAPLFVASGRPRDRRTENILLSSSYGAVYGMLRDDARSLYIADAMNGRDYAFDLSGGGFGTRVAITDAAREEEWSLIREQIGTIASQYRFTP